MSSRRISIFTELYYPVQTSTGFYISQIAEHLALNNTVRVICTTTADSRTPDRNQKADIIRLSGEGINGNNLIIRLIKHIYISIRFYQVAKRLLGKDDHVICLTNPSLALLGMSRLKKKLGFKYYVLVHDVFPENIIGSGIISRSGVFYNSLLSIFNRAYMLTDKIIVIGRDMRKYFKNKLPEYMGEIVFIPIWGNPNSIFPIESSESLKTLVGTSKSPIKIQFSGNIGRAQNIQTLLEVATSIQSGIVSFVFYGDGALCDIVKDHALRSSNIEYGGRYPREETNAYLNNCDIGLVSIGEGMRGLGVPSKTYDIMAAGKPILYFGPDESEIALLLSEEDIGWKVSPTSLQQLVETIESISKLDKRILIQKGMHARKVLIERYSREKVLKEYELLFWES